MTKPQFVYVTYILTSPERVWNALTDPEMTQRYWVHSNVSDWKVGSAWRHEARDGTVDVLGEVLESDPPRRLVTSWTPASKAGDPTRLSRVTYEIERVGEKVRLTVSHTELTEEGLRDISRGWPAVLSNLKTLLETGQTIPDIFAAMPCQEKAA